jgi:hypothetical protein
MFALYYSLSYYQWREKYVFVCDCTSVCMSVIICLISYFKIKFNKIWVKEKFEDTNGVIRSRKSKKDRQCNYQKKKDKEKFKDIKGNHKSWSRTDNTTIILLVWIDVKTINLRPKKKICVFTVTRPTLIFASDPMHFYTEFG